MVIKKEILFLGLCLVILFSLQIAIAEQNSKIDEQLSKQLDTQEKVKVIISVEENNNQNKGFFKIFSQGNQDSRENIINEIGKDKVEHKFSSSNSFSAELTKQEIENLANENSVKKIYYNSPVHAFLQDSVGIINATLTWPLQANGINLTGAGQTICIIDSGVNYSHADLGGCYGNNSANSTCKILGGYDYVNSDSNPMDDFGHGTHIAGITSANGTIKGVAPDSKIIAIKGLNSAGNGNSGDIIAGIDWCIDNSSIFNISVISLSLGTSTLNTTYCNDDSFAPSINSAVSKNISVVVSTGNAGNWSALPSPACVQNATRVGATDKSDAIASYSNRNNLTKLFAPGSDINSTRFNSNACPVGCSCSGNYMICSGTSMAAPHVAGAIAIINQLLKSGGNTKTPLEIETILNQTGKPILDSTSGLTFSRINLYSAILYYMTPSVYLISPLDNLLTNQNQSFFCNASSNITFKNVTFYLWNSTGDLINSNSTNISGYLNNTNVSYNFGYDGTFKWNCLFFNNASSSSYALSNFSIRYDSTKPSLNIISPINNSWYNAGRFNISLNENGSCLYSLDLGKNNVTMNSSDNLTFYNTNSSLLQNETFNLTYYCNDSAGNLNSSDSIIFNIDLTQPLINLISPLNGDSSLTGTSTVSFSFNVSDNLNISRCNLIIDGVSSTNSSAINASTNIISASVVAGTHIWNITCTDEAGNTGNSSSRSLVINSPAVVVSSGGGGGGGGGSTDNFMTYSLTKEQTSIGQIKELKKLDKIKFEIFDIKSEQHILTLNSIGENFANITIQSTPINIILGIGQSAKFNLTSPDFYDLYVKLENISKTKANITIQTIHDPIIKQIVIQEQNKTLEQNITNEQKIEQPQVISKKEISIILITIILLASIIVFYFLKTKQKQEKIKQEIKRLEKLQKEKARR
ncbi:MAG: S8 family serine peptidase [Nanoarchaeota archaeon]|nr:S8 family serine peptidase [Nanoarchaeota archaeon]